MSGWKKGGAGKTENADTTLVHIAGLPAAVRCQLRRAGAGARLDRPRPGRARRNTDPQRRDNRRGCPRAGLVAAGEGFHRPRTPQKPPGRVRKGVRYGKSVSVRLDHGGRRLLKKKTT